MKDEEMAEEWVKDNCCDLCVCQDECEIGCIHCGAKDGFLAGLKAGRPQRHDLRKNPDDLPKDSKEVLIITSDNRKHIGFYDKDWYCSECGGIVIAWCEIPKFEGVPE